MPTFNGTESYADGSPLTKALLTSLVDSIETFLNTTKLDSDNIQIGGIATANLADSCVTAAKIATSVAGNGLAGGAGTAFSVNVDASTIEINADTLRVKDAGITATKIETSPNINGKATKVASQMVVVSANPTTNQLLIIRGLVSTGGTSDGGEGFSCSRSGAGRYTITYTTAFNSVPAVTVTALEATPNARIASLVTSSTTGCNILTADAAGAATDSNFHFIAIGERT